jgi:hypothetical protein
MIFGFIGSAVHVVIGGLSILNAKVNQDGKKCRREMSGSIDLRCRINPARQSLPPSLVGLCS